MSIRPDYYVANEVQVDDVHLTNGVRVGDAGDVHLATVECRHVIDALGLSYHEGVAFAYLWRAHRKCSAADDLRKAVRHLQFELQRMERAENAEPA